MIRELKETLCRKLLRRRLTDTPTDVQSLLVRSSVDLFLNKEETLSEQVLLTLDNNPEGVQPECTRGLKAKYVHVLSNKNFNKEENLNAYDSIKRQREKRAQ